MRSVEETTAYDLTAYDLC